MKNRVKTILISAVLGFLLCASTRPGDTELRIAFRNPPMEFRMNQSMHRML